MAQMNNIAINTQVVEQIETAYKGLEVSEPSIDIKKDLEGYVNSLEYEEVHERENKVKNWIEARVSAILTIWAGSYAPSSQLLQKTNTEIDSLEKLKADEQRNIYNIQDEISKRKLEVHRKEDDINEHKVRLNTNRTIDIKEEWKRAKMLLFFSFFIAIGTYVYFINSQINIKWSTISKSEKVAQVKEMLIGGALNQYSAFDSVIRVDDTTDRIIQLEDLKLSDLSGITVDNIYLAPKPTILQAVFYDGTIISLAFISFILILFGKVTAILYEKIGYPRWMFIIIWILFAFLLSSAIFSVSYLDEQQIYKTTIIDDIQRQEGKISKIKEENTAGFGGNGGYDKPDSTVVNPKIVKLEEEIRKKRIELKEIIKNIGSFKFITMILFFLSEVIVGSLGWMSYSEYIEKRTRVGANGEDVLTQLKDELKELENKIIQLTKDAQSSQQKIADATGLESRLVSIKSKLFSTDKIHNIEKQHLDKAIADGLLLLQQAKHKWQKNKDS